MDSYYRLDSSLAPPIDDVSEQAQLVLLHLDWWQLFWRTLVAAGAFIAFCIGDIVLNLQLLGARFATEFGEKSGSLIVYGTSFITLGGFILIGALYGSGKRRAAIVFYILLLALLAFLLLPVFDGLITENFSFQGSGWFGDGASISRGWWFWLIVPLLTLAFSVPGLCVCWYELILGDCWERWSMRREAQAILDARSAARQTIATCDGLRELRKRDDQDTADGWTGEALLEYRGRVEAQNNNLRSISGDGRHSRAQRHRAYSEFIQGKSVIDSLRGPDASRRALLGVLFALPLVFPNDGSAAQPGAELVARAPTMIVVIDDSSDAPARSPEIMKHAARRAAEIVAELPMASNVVIMVGGDPVRQLPFVLRSRVQARPTPRGTTATQLAGQVRNYLLVEFPQTPKPDNQAGSSIILALRDAARLLNPEASTPNRIYLVSDMLERSSLANCYRDCRLPKPDFKFVANTRVEILGIGLRLPDHQAIALFKPWQKWLEDAGAGELKLYRSY